MLKGKFVVIGIAGGIAAYKTADLISKIKKMEGQVQVIMTEAAKKFITPLTLQTLSQNPVITGLFTKPRTWEVEHVSLAEKADVFVIAPATANIIGKVANGIADDFLSTTIMATKAPVIFVPAMNTNMYENPITQNNINTLKKTGYSIIEPETGFLACGYTGRGRMPETSTILDEIYYVLEKKDFKGKKILITAGPTRESIDPVRFISNHSSGKMGYCLAKAARLRGGKVTLISGPTYIEPPRGVKLIKVITACEMLQRVLENFEEADIIIKAAAVSDYRPKNYSNHKIKKKADDLQIPLERNPDILYEIGKRKGHRILLGFAAETQNLIENAIKKLKEKNLDFIVANDLTKEGAGFAVDTNIVKIIDADGNIEEMPKMKKELLANIILDKVISKTINKKNY